MPQAKTTIITPAVMTVRPIRKMMLLLKICAIEISWEQTWKTRQATKKPITFDEPILCLHRHTPNQMTPTKDETQPIFRGFRDPARW